MERIEQDRGIEKKKHTVATPKTQPSVLAVLKGAVLLLLVNALASLVIYAAMFLWYNLYTIFSDGLLPTITSGGSFPTHRLHEKVTYGVLIHFAVSFISVILNEGGTDWLDFLNLAFSPLVFVGMLAFGASICGACIAVLYYFGRYLAFYAEPIWDRQMDAWKAAQAAKAAAKAAAAHAAHVAHGEL